jgi:hypothetical protein
MRYQGVYIYKRENVQQHCIDVEKQVSDNIEVYQIQERIMILLFSNENIPSNKDNCYFHN